jgi:UDP-N-acetyl-D-mannosaminuronic acid dehydrogenase
MVNQSMVGHTISLIEDVAAPLDNATVAVLGVAYKGGVADTRNSPGLRLARQLQSNWPSIEVRLTDPHVDDQTLDLKPFEEAVRDADVAVLITDHDTFGDLGPADFDPMATPKLVDTRGVLDQVVFEDGGFDFVRL